MADLTNIGCVFSYKALSLTIKGTVLKEETPVSKSIHIVEVATGDLLAQSQSNELGEFEIEGVPLNADFDIIVHY